MKLNLWVITQACLVLLCVGLVASVQAEEVTHVEEFHLTWSQLIWILGGVGALFGAAAELRRWMIDLDRRVKRIEDHCDKEKKDKQ